MPLYLDEFVYRFNRRWRDGELFGFVLARSLESAPCPYHRLTAESLGWAREDKFVARGVVLGIGPFGDGGNMAIFKTRAGRGGLFERDPFILEGLVKSFVIKDWGDSLLPE